MTIRPARADDAETLLAVQRDACLVAFAHIFPPEDYPFPDEGVLANWRMVLAEPETEVYIAEAEAFRSARCRSAPGSSARSTSCRRTSAPASAALSTTSRLERLRAQGNEVAKLWTLEENWNARRYYEKRGWELTDETRVVPFPPNPLDVQYAKPL